MSIRRVVQLGILLAGFVIHMAHAERAGGGFEYVAWEDESLWLVPPGEASAEGYIGVPGHIHYAAEYCSSDSGYHCVFGIQYAFAVPKNLGPEVDGWSYKGVNFRVLKRNAEVAIFGCRYDEVFVIETPSSATALGRESGRSSVSLYSAVSGLVGFNIPIGHPVFWSKSREGFGASDQADDMENCSSVGN